MSGITYEEYVSAIRNKYALQSGGDLSSLLAKPTRASLKKACIEAFDIRKQQSDKKILKQFFDIQDEDGFNIKKEFDKDKFVPIINFLKGKTDLIQSSTSLELVALLIDFKPRPFLEYKKNTINIANPALQNKPENQINQEPKTPWKTITITISFISIISAIVYFAFNWKQKDCMTWSEDHYEKIACDDTPGSENKIADQEILEKFVKAKMDTIETFFDNGRPLYWYTKTDGEIELFTAEGEHPISGKKLRPITEIIVRKYVYKEDL
ncbi:hypothetical protein [Aquimarina sp. MMG016]|uniref:hypothetical protein n=1 Tax=Aquimarina sp. MMG016 TaxID=2822690 RepID=UPI001B3A654D|nr:hypothetical protein [Aquimarina sp. MMG016]MBQ4819604.1 hypothetical protein [Aquimarina sp. MMG016]